jgi:hypothetical protein
MASTETLRDTDAEFIRTSAPWTWWCTLTFKRHLREEEAERILKQWMREVAMVLVGEHLMAAWALEPTKGGRPHYHVLLLGLHPGSRQPTVADLRRAWLAVDRRCGFTKIARYDPARGLGVGHYLSKGEDYDLGVVCPRHPGCRRARGRCLVAASAW